MTKKSPAKKPAFTQNELVQCDLEFPSLLAEISALEAEERDQLFNAIDKISQMTWQQVFATASKTEKPGINWEVISNQKTASGAPIASIRISKRVAKILGEKSNSYTERRHMVSIYAAPLSEPIEPNYLRT